MMSWSSPSDPLAPARSSKVILQLAHSPLEHPRQSPLTSQVLTRVQSLSIGVTGDLRYPSSRLFLLISRVMLETLLRSSRAISLVEPFAFKSR